MAVPTTAEVNGSLVAPVGPYRDQGSDGANTEAVQEVFDLPEKLQMLFQPARFKVAEGGRGGAKSWGFARALLILGACSALRILCARELQVSITDSVHKLLADQITMSPNMREIYDVQKKTILGATGTEFIFSGIQNNVNKIKSMEGIDICWVEEAATVSKDSWEKLIPTIRKPGSEIWVSFNPDQETDPTSLMFCRGPEYYPPGTVHVTINHEDNPWFPEELRIQMEYAYRTDPEAAEHIWGGKFRRNSHAQVLKDKYSIQPFIAEPDWDGPYYGADFGYSSDPSTLIKCYIHDNRLYIAAEAYGHGVEIDGLPKFYDQVAGAKKRTIRADSALPGTISYCQRHGYGNMIGAIKGPGSVEDGVKFLRSFVEIIIHPSCKHTAEEARLWQWKVDRLTKEPTTDLLDKHNHCWDAIRYALEPMIKASKIGLLNYLKNLATETEDE